MATDEGKDQSEECQEYLDFQSNAVNILSCFKSLLNSSRYETVHAMINCDPAFKLLMKYDLKELTSTLDNSTAAVMMDKFFKENAQLIKNLSATTADADSGTINTNINDAVTTNNNNNNNNDIKFGTIVGFKQLVSNISSSKRKLEKTKWGEYNNSNNINQYSIGEMKAWCREYGDGNSFQYIYGKKGELFPIVGFQQEYTSNDSKKRRVIYNNYKWGNCDNNSDKNTKRSIGSFRAWSPTYGWGHAYYYIYLDNRQDIIVGFKQECSSPDSKKPWVVVEKWGTIIEGNGIKAVHTGHGRAWSQVYGESYSKRYLYVRQ